MKFVLLLASTFMFASPVLAGDGELSSGNEVLEKRELNLTPFKSTKREYQKTPVTCYTTCGADNTYAEVEIEVFYGRLFKVTLEQVTKKNCENQGYLAEPPVCEQYLGS